MKFHRLSLSTGTRQESIMFLLDLGLRKLRERKELKSSRKDDKRQVTALFAGSMTGDFLPPQLIYQGKTQCSLPKIDFPADWHWSNQSIMKDYVQKILLPYVERKRRELMVAEDYLALVLFDNFKAQCTPEILKVLDDNNINVLLMPPNCTDRLQPLDLTVNKSAKDFLRSKFKAGMLNKFVLSLEEIARKAQLTHALV